jgi:hypothetical protein
LKRLKKQKTRKLKMPKRPIELLRAAHAKKRIELSFEIPIDEKTNISAVLTAPDLYSIWEEQGLLYERKLADLNSSGDDKRPINDSTWTKELEGLSGDALKAMMATKPKTLAEQMASKLSRYETIYNLVPRFLRTPDRKLLFPTNADRKEFKEIMYSDANLMKLISQKYLELSQKVNEVGQDVKNLPAQEN